MTSMALSSFNVRPLLVAQFLMSSTQLCMASMALSSSTLDGGLKEVRIREVSVYEFN